MSVVNFKRLEYYNSRVRTGSGVCVCVYVYVHARPEEKGLPHSMNLLPASSRSRFQLKPLILPPHFPFLVPGVLVDASLSCHKPKCLWVSVSPVWPAVNKGTTPFHNYTFSPSQSKERLWNLRIRGWYKMSPSKLFPILTPKERLLAHSSLDPVGEQSHAGTHSATWCTWRGKC